MQWCSNVETDSIDFRLSQAHAIVDHIKISNITETGYHITVWATDTEAYHSLVRQIQSAHLPSPLPIHTNFSMYKLFCKVGAPESARLLDVLSSIEPAFAEIEASIKQIIGLTFDQETFLYYSPKKTINAMQKHLIQCIMQRCFDELPGGLKLPQIISALDAMQSQLLSHELKAELRAMGALNVVEKVRQILANSSPEKMLKLTAKNDDDTDVTRDAVVAHIREMIHTKIQSLQTEPEPPTEDFWIASYCI